MTDEEPDDIKTDSVVVCKDDMIWFDRVTLRRTLKLWWGLAILGMIVVLCALVLASFMFVANRSTQGEARSNRQEIEQLHNQLNAISQTTADKLVCARRYQDVVDAVTEEQLITIGGELASIGNLVVAITATAPGPERIAAVSSEVAKLGAISKQLGTNNELYRKAINDKIEYNKEGNPLPCPITEVAETPPTTTTTTP